MLEIIIFKFWGVRDGLLNVLIFILRRQAMRRQNQPTLVAGFFIADFSGVWSGSTASFQFVPVSYSDAWFRDAQKLRWTVVLRPHRPHSVS